MWEAPNKSSSEQKEEDPDSIDITQDDIDMILVNILDQSPFLWRDIFETETLLVATGFESSAFVVSKDGGSSYVALGKAPKRRPSILQSGSKTTCLSIADDFLRMTELSDAAQKTNRWLKDRPSEKQIQKLQEFGYQNGFWKTMTKYDANCHLAFRWNQRQIEKALHV